MVCEKCQKKLGKVACSDPFAKKGNATGVAAAAPVAGDSGGRKVGENKALSSKKNRFQPYEKFNECRVCKSKVHQAHAHYCQGCAYKIGICAMCGVQVQDTTMLKQSAT